MSTSMSKSYTLLNTKFSEEGVGLCDELHIRQLLATSKAEHNGHWTTARQTNSRWDSCGRDSCYVNALCADVPSPFSQSFKHIGLQNCTAGYTCDIRSNDAVKSELSMTLHSEVTSSEGTPEKTHTV